MTDSREICIKNGIVTFALSGQCVLKTEPIAMKVVKNKSSSYHYFADLELFVDMWLKHHFEQSSLISEMEQMLKILILS